MKHQILLCLLVCCFSCVPSGEQVHLDDKADSKVQAEKEVLEIEAAFTEMAAKEGVPAAFLAFAAEDAVLMRGNRIIEGKSAMEDYFKSSTLEDVKLEWTPGFVRASKSGDMAYTYGPYTFSARDTSGQPIEATGIFHTVWVKQEDGQWKFVYD